MSTLPNAPLAYTLGIVQFPDLPQVERFASNLHDGLRGRLPLVDDINLPQVSFEVSQQGLQMSQKTSRLWQFATPDRRTAFVFTSRLLLLHTIAYPGHRAFFDLFRWGLEHLRAVEDVRLEWMSSVGLRYVNRIVPGPDESLTSYLVPSILPKPFDDPLGITLLEAAYVSRHTTPVGEMRFQVLRNPPSALPPDVETPLVHMNGWVTARPEREFAIVDIDHGTRFANLEPMDAEGVHRHMFQLRQAAKSVFDGMGTAHANSSWERQVHDL